MLFIALVGWWYTTGWKWAVRQFLLTPLQSTIEFFSVGDLLKTLFAPFRQDSITIKNAAPGLKIQAMGENLISRLIGFMIRIVLIGVGLITATVVGVLGLLAITLWPLLPLTPIIAAVLFVRQVGS